MATRIEGGQKISSFSRAVLASLAEDAGIPVMHVTSVQRTVGDQARIMVQKHVVGSSKANYRNPAVSKLIEGAKAVYTATPAHKDAKGATEYLADGILHLKGGPSAASRHIVATPFVEVFDIAHWGNKADGTRRNWLNDAQAKALLAACRKRYGFPIQRLGVSAELKPAGLHEFKDEKCFHFEILQPILSEGGSYLNTV